MVHSVGSQLCRHLDHYVESNSQAYERGKLRRVVENKQGVVGRLLHYFPQQSGQVEETGVEWCGWHNDHSALTGLTSAVYIDTLTQ